MNKKIYFAIFCLPLMMAVVSNAQNSLHPQSEAYQPPADKKVQEKLETWRNKKFGMIIHWGIYAVPGIIESWSICSEDWINRDSTISYEEYKKWYFELSQKFNPVKFDPTQWARAAKNAGMKYMVFTTKHHDGFAMFDTGQSDFNIAAGPFAGNPKRDVARHVFDAFREQGFMIGAYFSKPDWHSPYYWWPKYATPDRNNNYDIKKYPWRWNQFKQYTHAQINELMSRYGSIDILWLDGGWVRPRETVNKEVLSWGAPIPAWSQDIDIATIAGNARKLQPGLLVVDRTVHGEFENYQTPEQHIPDHQISYPWESCITLGNSWGYTRNEKLKSTREVIHKLVEIVAKGGSLLLGVGPDPDGLLPEPVVERLAEIGSWLSINGAALYGTRTTKLYNEGNTWFTGSADGKTVYGIYLIRENAPATIQWSGNKPMPNAAMRLLNTGKNLKWQFENGKTTVWIPETTEQVALAFSFAADEKFNQ